jgi:hypothetical protein
VLLRLVLEKISNRSGYLGYNGSFHIGLALSFSIALIAFATNAISPNLQLVNLALLAAVTGVSSMSSP